MKHLVIGCGSNGIATSYQLSNLFSQHVDIYDIDPNRTTAYGNRVQSIDSKYDVYHICTPEDVVQHVLCHIPSEKTVVIHSTMPVGYTRRISSYRIGLTIYNPLFFRDKFIEEDTECPNRLILGIHGKSVSEDTDIIQMYILKAPSPIAFVSFEEAEIIKLGTNALRAIVIELYNEIFDISERFEANAINVFQMMNPADILGKYEGGKWGTRLGVLGQAFGGKCLAKDLEHLDNASDLLINIFGIVQDLNDNRK